MEEKQCTLKQWKNNYNKERAERQLNSPASRLRFGIKNVGVVVTRSAPSVSPIFGRCAGCGAVNVYGVCNSCGWIRVCFCCRRVIQKNGVTLPMPYDEKVDVVSHGICDSCYREHYPVQFEKLKKEVAV